ncbi:hypothetical protein BH09BAC5_BH09BAC5_07630 [soil metagenome]
MKVRKGILIIFLICFVFFIRGCIFPLVIHFNEGNLTKEERSKKLNAVYYEYMKLFKEGINKEFSYNNNFMSKSQNPIMTFVYKLNKGKDYEITIQKVKMNADVPLSQFSLQKNGAFKSKYVTAGSEMPNGVKFLFDRQHDSVVKNINIYYDDKFLCKTSSGDSLVNYNFWGKELSMTDTDESLFMGFESGFFTTTDGTYSLDHSEFNINVTLIKKGSSVFIVVIHPRDKNLLVTNQILNDLFVPKVELH